MKTISIKLYTFSELEKEAQEKATEHFRYFNTDHNWWESECEDFITICSLIGIHISLKEIYFRGFYSQGDGSCFISKIDVSAFIKGIAEQAWKSYAPTLELNIQPCTIDRRVIKLIENRTIEMPMWTDKPHMGYYVAYYSESYLHKDSGRQHALIEAEIEKLDVWVLRTLEQLNNYLYKCLECTYDYLISDEAIQETIEANEYHFTPNGVHTDWLCNYAE